MNPNNDTNGPDTGRATFTDRVRSLRLPDNRPVRARGSRLAWALVVLLALSTGLFAYQAFGRPRDQEPKPPEAASKNITDATAASGDVVLESKGYIIPAHTIQVSPKVGGMVVKLNILEGMRVQKGELLAEIETIDYLADRNRAQATLDLAIQRLEELENGNRPQEIKQAKAELEEAQANLKQLKLDWQRNSRLQPGLALSAKEYEQVQAAYESQERRVERLKMALDLMVEGPRKERIAAAKAEKEQAEADLKKAQWRLDNCKVFAPVNGTILTKNAEEGNIVNPVAFNVSAKLCDMADLSDLEVDLYIQERDIANVVVDQECRIMPEAFQSNERFLKSHSQGYDGKVSRLMPIADRAKGAIPVRVKVSVPREEEGVYLKPDMSVIVSFLKPKS